VCEIYFFLSFVSQQFCTTAGCKVRFVWTEADSALSASSSVVNTNSNGRDNSGGISMHKMVGYCGQLIIDWVGGTVYQSTMGVQWPSIYWYWLYSAAAVLGAGLFTQRQFVKQSSFGRWLRTPLNLLTVGEKYKQQSDSEPWVC
jgi:hypothetical protein